MKTKFDVGQTVLIKGKVETILVDEEKKQYYLTVVMNDSLHGYTDKISVEESQIVCGWIGGDTE